MADVRIKCAKCGKEMMVSEYVSSDALGDCSCGAKLLMPQIPKKKQNPTTVRYARDPATIEAEANRPRFRARRSSTLVRLGSWRISEYGMSWLIFLLLASVLSYFRYSDALAKTSLETYTFWGMVAMGLFHMVVIVDAFYNEFFEGLVSLMIPPYSLYYLYFKSDSFALRAIVGGLAVAFGLDMVELCVDQLSVYVKEVNDFIWSGGG